ncbi:hypothetical protein [Myroides sp. LoEW2-1]|uniref:hypothetical protein n=1 Tax=Myroides sp. LoEW2-1 TaxID=2683192 RepID=UPI00132406F3|nr:hypothetical protein [Myroides sp. LoEW2-1]MVX37288.1 hypothetical protein [Myroides sp. LoEW2-1]
MKNYIKNLFTGLAVIAMLSVGAFTVNASELKKDSKKESPVVESIETVKAENGYSGKIYYRYLNESEEYVYELIDNVEQSDCTELISNERCTTFVDGIQRNLWGELAPGHYIPLYKEM